MPNTQPHLQFLKAQTNLVSVAKATDRTMRILDASYEKADLSKAIRKNCKYEELFDGTLGDFQTDPVGFGLNLGAKPYHG